MVHIFNAMWTAPGANPIDFYNPMGTTNGTWGYVYSPYSGISVYASPDQDTGGDLVRSMLSNVVAGSGCVVRVMMNDITDARENLFSPNGIGDRLRDLKNAGCIVRVIVGACVGQENGCPDEPGAPKVGSGVKEIFRNTGGPRVPVAYGPVHDKTFAIRYTPAGYSSPWYLMLTGSHNLSHSALRNNDELVFKLAGSGPGAEGLYYAIQDHFEAASNRSTCIWEDDSCWSEVPPRK